MICCVRMILACLLTAISASCSTHYQSPSPALETALRDICNSTARQVGMVAAIDEALRWLDTQPSAIDEDLNDTRATLLLFRDELAQHNPTVGHLAQMFSTEAMTPPGSALVTAYYAPVFSGQLEEDILHRFPLYRMPDADDPSRPIALRSRREIETRDLLLGYEVIWLRDRFDAYVIHVNGSARIQLPDGSHRNVSHTHTNERPYTSIGRLLIDTDLIAESEMSLDAIRSYFALNPEQFEEYAHQNERFVFFDFVPDEAWPRGGLGMVITPMCSVAIDPTIYPPGSLLLLELDDGISYVMIAQDRGGAIIGAGRADMFIGIGPDAGAIAGNTIMRGTIHIVRASRHD